MAEAMLDPSWTPAAGYAHAAALVALCDKTPTIPHEDGKKEAMPTKKSSTAPAKPAGVSVKIPRRAYATAQRIARRDRRSITTTIELAIEKLGEEGGAS